VIEIMARPVIRAVTIGNGGVQIRGTKHSNRARPYSTVEINGAKKIRCMDGIRHADAANTRNIPGVTYD
jgi:hypothetical protein